MSQTAPKIGERYRLFFVNTLSNIFFRFFTVAVAFILTPLFVKNMGTELYALWVLNFTITNYFFVVDTSIAGGVVKHIAETRSDIEHGVETQIAVINNALIAYAVFGLCVAGLLCFGVSPLMSFFQISPVNIVRARDLLLVSGVVSLALWPLLVFPSVLKGLLLNPALNLIQGAAALATQVTLVIMVMRGFGLQSILMGYYAVAIFFGVVLAWRVSRAVPGLRMAPRYLDRSLMRKIIGFSAGLLLLEMIAMLAFQSDKLIIAYFLPISAVANYEIVTKIFYELRGFYGMFLGVIQPMVFEAQHNKDREFILRLTLKGMKYINIGYIPLIVLGMAVSKPFITIWMGPEFGQYGYWSTFFIGQYLVVPVVGVMGSVTVGMSKLRSLQILGIFSVSLNLMISIIMVRLIGFPGVLVGTVVTTYIVIIVSYIVYCKQIGIPWQEPIRANWKISAVNVVLFTIPGIVLANLLISSWVSLILFSALFLMFEYFILYIFFVDQEEKVFVATFIRSRFSTVLSRRREG